MSEENGYQAHEAFQDAGQQEGIEIWRIENFEPVRQDPKTYGKFYSGDAYIVLNTKGRLGRFNWNIHFWLGKNCAKDESGSAAIYSVELDDHLGGAPIQHREVEGHESKEFLAYFKKGIKYLQGGVSSGFTHVDHDAYEKRLYRCKGKHTIRVEQMPVACASLNQGDVFILDDGPQMYVWLGPKSSRKERMKGTEIARQIRDDEKGGRAVITIVEEEWNTHTEFFKALGSKDKEIRTGDKEPDDDIRKLDQDIVLYKIDDTDDTITKGDVIEVGNCPLDQALLESEHCYVLDAGMSGIFVWTGKLADNQFKKKVWAATTQFIDNRGYPDWVTITRIIDGGETPLFKQYFPDWDEPDIVMPGEAESQSNVAEQSYESVDGADLHEMEAPKVQSFMPDDGTGHKQVFRVEEFELTPVPEVAHGVFFGGDSYVIQYDYELNGREEHIIYFWQGTKSTTDEKGASALHAMDLDDNLGGRAVQIRVVMNKEPAHFLKMFGGKMVVFMGGHVTGFRDLHDHDDYDPDEVRMWHIHGDDENSTRALQVPARAASLNSNDVFIVESPKKIFVWLGKNASDSEKEMCKYMRKFLVAERFRDAEAVVLEEGSETRWFWDAIGGEEPYYTGPKKKKALRIPPRLFHCSNSSGKFVVEEIADFDQEDLDDDDVMILDTYDEIFIWVGSGANEFEKKESYKTAYSYLNSDPTGRTADNTVIIVVRQGFEPPQFTGHFHPWDTEIWAGGKTFQELIEEVGRENAGIALLEDEAKKYTQTHPYDVLKRRIPPEGVDVTKKEMYLAEEDFEQVFHMSKEDFLQLPEWKRINHKKEVGLF